jgi:hypothetical protein
VVGGPSVVPVLQPVQNAKRLVVKLVVLARLCRYKSNKTPKQKKSPRNREEILCIIN